MPQTTLVVFDEIQECNSALNSLKYFCEEAPEYAVACAGSLLGVALSRGASFPVGNVDFMQINPMSFSEYLAEADKNLFEYLETVIKPEPIPDIFFLPLKDKLKTFFLIGGMPEAVASFIENQDISRVQNILQNILNAYALDFAKHIDTKDILKINHIWSSLPSQLSRENKKFLYQSAKPGARARDYEDALTWLVNAGLVHKIYCSEKPGLPVSAYDDLSAFKIYLNDVGLLRRHAKLDPVAITEGDRLFTEFKGAMTENFILQGLNQLFEVTPRYWRSGNKAEVDFLVQYKNSILPAEVKSDENIKSKSLAIYRKSYQPEISIRYSMRNLKLDGDLLNIPLFMVDHTLKLLSMI
jgi:predicted AAA+ superfamily ATPase